MVDTSKLYRQYSVQEKRRIYGINMVIAIVSGASVVILLGSQNLRQEAKFKHCTLRRLTNYDTLYLIIASAVTVPYLVNGVLFGIPRYRYAEQVRLLKQDSVMSVSKVVENAKNTHNVLPDISRKYRYHFEDGAIGHDTKRRSAPNQEVIGKNKAPGLFIQIAKKNRGNECNKAGEKSCEDGKNTLSFENFKPTSQISPNMFVVRTKARALREMGTTILIDAVIPVLFAIICIVCIFSTFSLFVQLRTILLTLVYVKDSLKTTLMVIRYGVIRSAMRDMLSALVCSTTKTSARC